MCIFKNSPALQAGVLQCHFIMKLGLMDNIYYPWQCGRILHFCLSPLSFLAEESIHPVWSGHLDSDAAPGICKVLLKVHHTFVAAPRRDWFPASDHFYGRLTSVCTWRCSLPQNTYHRKAGFYTNQIHMLHK